METFAPLGQHAFAVQPLPVMMPVYGAAGAASQPAPVENAVGEMCGGGSWPLPAPSLPGAPQASAIPVSRATQPDQAAPSVFVPFATEGIGRAPQPQTLMKAFDPGTGTTHVRWTVDARKLRGNDKHAVSPHFDIHFGSHLPSVVPFKMMIGPNSTDAGKGGACFKKACGKGFVQLKCESMSEAALDVAFRFAIGNGKKKLPACRFVEHNFSASAICEQTRTIEWDFNKAVDQESMTFDIFLEVSNTAALSE
jgi:hypothetical protein